VIEFIPGEFYDNYGARAYTYSGVSSLELHNHGEEEGFSCVSESTGTGTEREMHRQGLEVNSEARWRGYGSDMLRGVGSQFEGR
jgi:hypothetical protein